MPNKAATSANQRVQGTVLKKCDRSRHNPADSKACAARDAGEARGACQQRLRQDNWPEFERFRSALRTAIREQIDRAGTRTPEEIARAVVQEYVDPELADIERQLSTAKKGLARKIGAGVTLGGATVTAGTLSSTPLVVATRVAALATSLPQVYKFFEDKKEIEMSDLYFLWKARIRDVQWPDSAAPGSMGA